MSRKGLGMQCPDQIAERLRAAGWKGYNGWWMHEARPGPRCRWYEAVAAEMRGDTSSRKRKADHAPAPIEERCARTPDLFASQVHPITQEVIDALKPKPRGVGMRIGLKR